MTAVDDLARFVVEASWEDIPQGTCEALKIRLLDALGCAIAAQDGPPIRAIREGIEEFGGRPLCSFIGGGRGAPDDAALYNAALVRYLDFNDSYLAPGETCHPSDNLGAVLAAAQYAQVDGRVLLTALAVAYHVQCRLSRHAPVRMRYFDHTTQGAYAVAAGTARALGLDAERTANAIAIAGTALNALRVTRTSLSHWKGLAYPFTAFAGTRAAFLAARGVTGPRMVLEGRKGFMEAIAGPFEIDWQSEGLDAVLDTSVKRFNAEVHSQSAVEAVLELRRDHALDPRDVERVDVDTFDVAYSIIGGGDEGQKKQVTTKEEADHSMPYMVAVALLDGQLLPEQYEPARIVRDDVRRMIGRVYVRSDRELSRRFPGELPARVRITLAGGGVMTRDKCDYAGYRTRPATREDVGRKFAQLAQPWASDDLQARIASCVDDLEHRCTEELMLALQACGPRVLAAGPPAAY